jgi:hypothetical protein
VTAAIVTDASGARLTLRSKETGATQALRITATDAGGAPTTSGLGTLAFDPPGGATGLTQTQAARNAEATLNGLAITSESNTLSGVLDGASITLLKETGTTAVNVAVASDTTAMKTALTAFTSAYNALNSYLAEQTKYDESTKTAGTLQGDSTAIGLRNQMRGLLRAGSTASGAFGSLTDIGFNVQRDGSISTDPGKLEKAFAKLPELAKLFSSADDSSADKLGFGQRFRQLADQVTGSEGTLTTRNDGPEGAAQAQQRRAGPARGQGGAHPGAAAEAVLSPRHPDGPAELAVDLHELAGRAVEQVQGWPAAVAAAAQRRKAGIDPPRAAQGGSAAPITHTVRLASTARHVQRPRIPAAPRAHAFTQAYRSVGVETGVGAATPHQLVAMLYDGLLDSLARARGALRAAASTSRRPS